MRSIGPVAQHAEQLCRPDLRLPAGAGGGCRPGHESPGAAPERQARDSEPAARAHRAVLDWATVRGYRKGENPARWRGHLDKLLPARSKVRQVEHHAALPYDELSDFILELQAQEGVAAQALEFLILAAARTGEVIAAQWAEVNLIEKVWVVPAARILGRRYRCGRRRIP
jgi:integrase